MVSREFSVVSYEFYRVPKVEFRDIFTKIEALVPQLKSLRVLKIIVVKVPFLLDMIGIREPGGNEMQKRLLDLKGSVKHSRAFIVEGLVRTFDPYSLRWTMEALEGFGIGITSGLIDGIVPLNSFGEISFDEEFWEC